MKKILLKTTFLLYVIGASFLLMIALHYPLFYNESFFRWWHCAIIYSLSLLFVVTADNVIKYFEKHEII